MGAAAAAMKMTRPPDTTRGYHRRCRFASGASGTRGKDRQPPGGHSKIIQMQARVGESLKAVVDRGRVARPAMRNAEVRTGCTQQRSNEASRGCLCREDDRLSDSGPKPEMWVCSAAFLPHFSHAGALENSATLVARAWLTVRVPRA